MKVRLSIFSIFFASILCMFPVALLFGEAMDPTIPLPENAFWEQLSKFLQGIPGAGVLMIVGGVVQVAMIFLITPYGNFTGKAKRLIVLGLSCVGVYIGNLMAGLQVLPAFFSGPMLAAIQIFAFEVFLYLRGAKETLSIPGR